MQLFITLFLLFVSVSFAQHDFCHEESLHGESSFTSFQNEPFTTSNAMHTYYDPYAQHWLAVTVHAHKLVLALSRDKTLSERSTWRTFTLSLNTEEYFEFPTICAGPEFILIGANILDKGHFSTGIGFLIPSRELDQAAQARAVSFALPLMYAPWPLFHEGKPLFVSVPSESQEALIIEHIDAETLDTRLSRITVPLFLDPEGSSARITYATSQGPLVRIEHTIGCSGKERNEYGQKPVYSHKRTYLFDLGVKKAVKIEDDLPALT